MFEWINVFSQKHHENVGLNVKLPFTTDCKDRGPTKVGPYKSAQIAALLLYCGGATAERRNRRAMQ